MRLPDTTSRVVVVGRNGTGKTLFGWWLLSLAPLERMPYIIIDFKGEAVFRQVPRIKELQLSSPIPRDPGLYIVRPLPTDADKSALESFMWRIWKQGRCGIFCDEGYLIPDREAFPAILTQGRAKHIPAIICVQRPSWLSRFVFSEANFYAVFHLNDRRDEQTVENILPKGTLKWDRPAFHALWYDTAAVAPDSGITLISPVPPDYEISQAIENKLAPRRYMS